MNIIETAKGMSFYNRIGNEFYIKDQNVMISFYADSIRFVELENAMKPGKTCEVVSICFDRWNDEKSFVGVMNELKPADIASLVQIIREELYEFENLASVYVKQRPSIKTFSPFVTVKPIKKPEKWTRTHVYKAIMSGQIQSAKQVYYYTDDYAGDAADNFRKGWKIDLYGLARELVSTSSDGYYIREDAERSADEKTILRLNCYHFDSKELVFVA